MSSGTVETNGVRVAIEGCVSKRIICDLTVTAR